MTNYINALTKSPQQYEFTFAELFAGIGGVSFGFESVGGKCVLAAEYDPTAEGKRQFAQDAYKTLHPTTPIAGDVFKLDAKDVPDHDVLSFTTPCQSFSIAGKRAGFDDIRGTLVFEALRIANEKRPKALFMENVKGLVNHDKGHTLDTILLAMNEIGYTVDFNVLNSKYFGVPQNRERVFIIALRDDLVEPAEWTDVKGSTILPKAKKRLTENGLRTFNFDWPEQTDVKMRLKDVLEPSVDAKYYLAEDKTAKLTTELSQLEKPKLQQMGYVDKNMQGNRIYDTQGISGTMAAQTGGLGGSGAGLYLMAKEGIAIRETTTQGVVEREEVRPVITPERTNKRQKGRRFKEDGEEAFTCTAIDQHGVAIGEYPQYRIRKLTPRETMRLQGFPEAATDLLYSNGFSDSRIYKFAGNAVTTTVIKAVAERLTPLIADELEAVK